MINNDNKQKIDDWFEKTNNEEFIKILNNDNMQKKESKTNWHFRISLAKSCLRIMAGVTLISDQVLIAGVLLIVAEVFGIVEEL